MAGSKRRLFAAFHFSRKLALVTGGLLVILGASGTAAVIATGPGSLIPGFSGESGGHCRTLYSSSFDRAGERRALAIIQSDDEAADGRIKTGIRLARHLSDTLDVDLVTVQMAGLNGPVHRAELRGPAIGAEIAYAPNPNRTRATDRIWRIRYIDAPANEFGYFYGPRVEMEAPAIALLEAGVEKASGCDGDAVETAEANPAAPASAGGHDAPASGH